MKIYLLLLLLLIPLSSALYQGETITVSSGLDNISGVVFVENTSAVGWVQISQSEINVTIPEDYTAGTFHIVFYGYTGTNPDQQNIVYVGGGGHTIYKNVTQNVIKEVPVDRIVYVNNNSGNTTIINEPAKPAENIYVMPNWMRYIAIVLLIAVLIAIIYYVLNKDNNSKGGIKNEIQ